MNVANWRLSHRYQKVLNALILLNCDEGACQTNSSTNEQFSSILGISDRKINRVKKRFVEECLHVALHERKGGSCVKKESGWWSWGQNHCRKLFGVARGVFPVVASHVGRPGSRVGLCGWDFSWDGAPDIKKNELKPWKQNRWVNPTGCNSEFVASMEQVLDVYKHPYDPLCPIICMVESPRQLISETRRPVPSAHCPGARGSFRLRRPPLRCLLGFFIANDPLSGLRIVNVFPNRTKNNGHAFSNTLKKSSRTPGELRW